MGNLDPETSTTFGAVAVVVLIYYGIAIALVYYFGWKWFIPAWSFPIVLLIVFALPASHKQITGGLFLYLVATAVLLAVVGLVLWVMHHQANTDQLLLLAIGVAAWLILSIAAVKLIEHTGWTK